MQEQIFIPRYYECDPYDHLNHAFYLRYAVESILGVLPRKALVTKVSIEFLRPASYQKPLKVQAEVSSETNESMVFDCTFSDEAGHRNALARVAMSYVASHNFAPMVEAPEPSRPWKEPPPAAFQTKRRVRWYHLNPAGHLDSAWYLSLFEDVVIDAAAAAGWTMKRAQQNNIGFFARSVFLEIGRPLFLDQEFNVTTYISEIGNTSALRENRMHFNDELIARSQIWWVFVDLATGRPARLPDTWMDDFAGQICVS
jgi:acyl-CoA thioester hydrolase